MIVEIDLFSGRPNPSWEVDDGVRLKVLEIEAGLMPEASAIEPPALGYRGFVYAADGVVRRAFGGRLIREDGAVLDDADRMIERLLLSSIPAELAAVRARLAALGIY